MALSCLVIACAVSVATRAATFNIPAGNVGVLIAAINASNTNGQSNIIELTARSNYVLTAVNNSSSWTGPSGLPVITGKIRINGHGATVSRSTTAPPFRIFFVGRSGSLELADLTLTGGLATSGAANQIGGGGAIRNDGGLLRISNSTLTANSGSPSGDNGGGAIFNYSGGQLVVINSTISANTGFSGYGGGGILNFTLGSVSKTTLINTTMFENVADAPPRYDGRGDAIADAFSPAGSIILKNSIVASPSRQGQRLDCYGAQGAGGAVTISSLGHNIASDNSCRLSATGDLNNTNPMLQPLANNHSTRQTHAPLPTSPVINAVPLADCKDTNGSSVAVDERGFTRPQGQACDIGAFERVSPALVNSISVGSSPQGVAVDPAVRRVYVAILNQQKLAVIDEDTNSVIANVSVSSSAVDHSPYAVAVGPGNRIYVANMFSNTLSVFKHATIPTLITQLRAGDATNPRSIAVNPQALRVYMSNSAIVNIQGATPSAVTPGLPLGVAPWGGLGVNPGAKRVYLANYASNNVLAINASTNTQIGSPIPVGQHPVAIAIHPATYRAFVANQADGTVSVILTHQDSNNVERVIPVGSNPFDLAINVSTNRVYVVNEASATISVIDGAAKSVIGTIVLPTSASARYIAIDESRNRAYVTDNRLDKVYVYDLGDP